MRHDLSDVVLVCPDNDPESRLILLLAYRLDMCVIRSNQMHGATLERERGDLMELILATGRPKVWIVEIPGSTIEQELIRHGQILTIIDHHTYGELDRSHGSDGRTLPSSLHQFMTLAQIDDAWLSRWGFDPVVVHGTAIMDVRFVQGLRNEGFTRAEIRRVLDYREQCARAGSPDFDKAQAAAREAWDLRREVAGYIVVQSSADISVRGAISTITVYEDCDTRPLIVADMNGDELFVQNVDPAVVALLQSAIPNGFTFGSGRCWGVNNVRSKSTYTLNHILGVLS